MAGSRAERLARRVASTAATAPAGNPRGRPRGNSAPERHVDPEPRVEHPEDNHDDHTEDDLDEEEASSLHPSRDRAASSLGRPAPSPATTLLMAQELLQYRPTPDAQEAWLNRVSELIGAARAAAPAPSRSLVPSALVGDVAHGAPPAPPRHPAPAPAPLIPPQPAPAGAPPRDGRAASHASSPHDCQIVQRAPEDARVSIERGQERRNRAVQDIATAGRHLRATLANGTVTYGTTAARRDLYKSTLSPTLNSLFKILLSCQLFTFSLNK